MNTKIIRNAEMYDKRHRRKRLWKRIIGVLGCLVVFCTTYALILPAITLDKGPVCGLEEHQHDASCYLKADPVLRLACTAEPHQHTAECYADGKLICGYANFFIHTHSPACWQDGVLVCTLPEIEEYRHTAECYIVNFLNNVP